MAVCIQIKDNSLLTQKLTIEEIAKLKHLNYGALSNNYTLIPGKIGKYTILYDPTNIGRGIEITLENDTIYLNLPLPSTISEIELFYNLTEKICQKLKLKQFYCDDELTTLGYANHFLETYKETSLNAILNIESEIRLGKKEQFIIFGALNPIFLGPQEIEQIDGTLEGFEHLINNLQQVDAFYANPVIYKRSDESLFAVYYLDNNIPTVIPLQPMLFFQPELKITDWYIGLPDNNNIPFSEFLTNIDTSMPYDNQHIIVNLTTAQIKSLVQNHCVDVITNQPLKASYWGETIDSGFNHSRKITTLKLKLDPLVGFNHLAIYLRWSFHHQLLSRELLDQIPDFPQIITKNQADLRHIIETSPIFSGALKLDHFNEVGQKFTKEYYVFNAEDLAFYPRCVDAYAEKYFGSKQYHSAEFHDEAYLFVPYNEEYYQGLSHYIDEAWNKFNTK